MMRANVMLNIARGICTVALTFILGTAGAQNAPHRYWVQFEGKAQNELPAGYSTPFKVDEPEAFLSPKAIYRRALQNIAVTDHDMPIPPDYVAELESISAFKVILKSKWFNAVTIALVDTTFDPLTLLELPMVTDIKSVLAIEGDYREPPVAITRENECPPSGYGLGLGPLEQLNADWLHGIGFTGSGMTIAVLDAGFENTESLPVFQRAWNEGRILEGMDAMQSQGGLFAHHRHGTAVLGTMAGHWKDHLIGTAPDATYILYRTEDAYSEYLIEEDYWVAAAEHADSIGVDLMNTSLGYSLFDDSTMNHVYDELNGTTTRISQAATWAAQKGILCTTSAGNSGAAEWHYITAPADAEGILTVGAVDADGNHAPFSGWGPTSDGRVKPDVMALGVQAAHPFADSTIRQGNGTSFASPILCGAAACLWQAFPDAPASDIRQAIIISSHLYATPNDSMGHGIPDFQKAFEWLDENGAATWGTAGAEDFLLFPNPCSGGTIRWMYKGQQTPMKWQLLDMRNQLVDEGDAPVWPTDEGHFQGAVDLPLSLKNGTYVFNLFGSNNSLIRSRFILMR